MHGAQVVVAVAAVVAAVAAAAVQKILIEEQEMRRSRALLVTGWTGFDHLKYITAFGSFLLWLSLYSWQLTFETRSELEGHGILLTKS